MGQNKEQYKGTGKVFAFTFRQMFFNKANLITMIIMMLVALLGAPLKSLFQGDVNPSGTSLTKIYYSNDTDYIVDFSKISEINSRFLNIPVEEASFKAEEASSNLGDEEALIVVSIQENESIPSVDVICNYNSSSSFQDLASAAATLLRQVQYNKVGVSEEQLEILSANISTSTDTLSSYEESQEGPDMGTQYMVQYLYAIFVMILAMFSSSYIIRAIIEEKDSKLVDLLMVSVKPLALILGKVLAVMAYVFGMIVALMACFFLSSVIGKTFLHTDSVGNLLSSLGVSGEGLSMSPFVIVVVLVSLILGYLIFSIFSGIVGTGCSTMDDMQAASMNVMFLVLAGYMISVFTVFLPGKVIPIILSFIPILSTFCAPVEYVLGNISWVVLVLSWIVQGILVWFLFSFCARIYESLILYKGNKMKIGTMIRMAKSQKKGGK